MTRTRTIAALAGLAACAAAGYLFIAPATAGATPPAHDTPAHTTPSHTPPAQAHPGQPVPRTGAPRASAGHGSTGHTPAAPAQPAHDDHHTDHASATHDDHHDSNHGSDHTTTDHGSSNDSTHADALVPTYNGSTPDAATALSILTDGNARWVSGHTQDPATDESTRKETADNGQHPFATILTCADSRIPVERVFDRGVGELFVIRVAGNIVDTTEAGTIEYGVEHLHTPVIIVMGHTGCGAVKAAVEGADTHGNVRFLIGQIEPAVRRASTIHPTAEGDELVNASVRENVMQSMFDLLATSDSIRSAVDNGDVQLVGAVYNIRTGQVEWLGSHPWQDGLISVLQTRQQPGLNTIPTDHATAEATGGRDGH